MCDTTMPYTNWKPRLLTLQKTSWVKTAKALENITAMQKGGFSKQENKKSNRDIFSELFQELGPFAQDVRFPGDVEYIAWAKMDWPDKKTQVFEALDHVENTEARDKRMQAGASSSREQEELRKFSRDDALHAFYQGCRRMEVQIINREGVYDREKFEEDFNLVWEEPAARGSG